eukprot:6227690-Pyramimonas_sp.AAC.1
MAANCAQGAAEWKEGMAKSGVAGGMRARETSWGAHMDKANERGETLRALGMWRDPVHDNSLHDEVRHDLESIQKYCRRAPRRKTFPEWGACAEMMAICSAQMERIDSMGMGLGFVDSEPIT